MLEIKKVESQVEWNEFIDFPWKIYENNPYWVPPLKISVRDILNTKKNPFYKHAKIYPLLAFKNGEVVGRILGIVDESHNKYHGEKTAFFGFYETIEDQKVSDLMIDEVAKWATSQGMDLLRGPFNPSTNYECGLLIQGFDDPPMIMTTYNPPYYLDLLENAGFKKAKDLLTYSLHSDKSKFSDRLYRHAQRVKEKSSVHIRPVQLKNFKDEAKLILSIYNDAWEKNWGFIPMDEEEFMHLAQDLKMIVDPELCLIIEVKGQPVAFGLTLPDVNQAIHQVKDGKLFPTGIFKLLWNLKGPGRKKVINRCRVILVGIKRDFRELALGPLIYTEYLKRGPGAGYPAAEASWILEDNLPMNRALEHMGGEKTKIHRILERSLLKK